MSIKFNKACFITSSLSTQTFPDTLSSHGIVLPEIALVGRSNVGKSSLINHLLRRQKLAKVSDKPGKTQTLNFFNVDDLICLVDLPGYGFAKAPKSLRMQWATSIDSYLKTRSTLKLLIILLDCRRIPSEEDIELILWAHTYNKPFLIILTKFDKLRAKERKPQKEKILEILSTATQLDYFTLLPYSTKNSHMRQVLINAINTSLETITPHAAL
jgi:GTP-binding protein